MASGELTADRSLAGKITAALRVGGLLPHEVRKGDHYRWSMPVAATTAVIHAEVIRVAKDGSWADIRYTQKVNSHATSTWTKRQGLPLSDEFEFIEAFVAEAVEEGGGDEEQTSDST